MIKRNKKGQSTIEFLFGFIFVFSAVFMFLKFSFNFTNGYFAHYATYMASRAYLSYDGNQTVHAGNDASALRQAQEVFDQYRVTQFIPKLREKLKANTATSGINPVYRGVYVQYKDNFSISSLIGSGEELTFLSESFLGREPSRAECLARTCAMIGELAQTGGTCTVGVTVSDNGC